MNTVKVNLFDTCVLVSRESGYAVCVEADKYLVSGESVILDFDGIEMVTNTFSDALLGRLIQDYGKGVLSRLSFTNCNPAIRSVLNFVASERGA